MAFAAVSEKYSGKMRELEIGSGDKKVVVGGQASMPFCSFDGDLGNKPVVAMEVYDVVDPEWPAAVVDPFKDVINDPIAWAKKDVEEYGAKMICLQLASTDPNGENRDADYAADLVKKVAEAISVEVKLTDKEEPSFGPDIEKRGVLWEAMTAVDMLLSGANVLIMRNPHAVKLTEEIIDELM